MPPDPDITGGAVLWMAAAYVVLAVLGLLVWSIYI
jgi:hypothetical protein